MGDDRLMIGMSCVCVDVSFAGTFSQNWTAMWQTRGWKILFFFFFFRMGNVSLIKLAVLTVTYLIDSCLKSHCLVQLSILCSLLESKTILPNSCYFCPSTEHITAYSHLG